MGYRALPCLLGIAAAAGLAAAQSAASAPPRIVSAAEGKAVESVEALLRDPATKVAAMAAAVDSFNTHYPKSDFRVLVNTDGLRYFEQPAHLDLAAMERYGAAVLALDANNLYVLMELGPAIPRLAPEDADDDQLSLAESYDRRTLEWADRINPTPGQTVVVDGKRLDYEQANQLEAAAAGGAQSSLGRIALRRKQFAAAIEAYQAAIVLEAPQQRGFDDYYLALAQAGLGDVTAARASLAEALNQDTHSPALRKAVTEEQVRLAPH